MSLNDLLNTDVEVVGARLRGALAWWIEELRAMAGPLVREGGARAKAVAERRPDGGYRLRAADGSTLEPREGRRQAVALVLPAEAVVVRTLAAPPLPERDIRRFVLLDIDRLTPFPTEAVYAAIAIARAETPGERAQVRLAVAPRVRVERELQDARAAGLEVSALVAPDDGGAVLDLLPAVRAARGLEDGQRGPWRAWLVVGVLVLANIGAAVWRDVRDTSRLQAAVAAQQPVAERVRRLRREAAGLRAEAKARAADLAAGDPLRVLDALSRVLPAEAYAQRLSWDGASVRLAGRRRGGADVAEALKRDPLFTDIRSTDTGSSTGTLSGDTAGGASTGETAFDVTAGVRRPPGAALPTPARIQIPPQVRP